METRFRRDKLSSGSGSSKELKNSFRTFVSRRFYFVFCHIVLVITTTELLILIVFFSFGICSKEYAMRDEKLAKVIKEFYIPDYIVAPEESNSSSCSGTSDDEDDAPSCPVIVFINSKSGGQLGRQLLITYRSLLNQNQVIVIVCFFS